MTAAAPWTTHGLDLFEHEHPHEILAWRGTELVGYAFPAVVAEPGGTWFGRLRGRDAVPFPSRHAALAYVVGGCPECRCVPFLCESDDTGRYCIDVGCGACQNGCPDDVCEMTKETS
jgi:hypothetical protein